MKMLLAVVITSALAVGCASLGADPYPGSGGLYFGTPSKADVESGRAVLGEAKYSSFQIGTTTKRQVVEKLGEPANWTTNPDGTSQLGYSYVQRERVMFRQVKEARFTFDRNLVLTEMRLPKSGA